jgi:RNA polymerase sigma factor (sigma-70 family)
LLERFATRKDGAAFAALVALHGPMVLGVCRRLLRDGHDVEDAFQATFLVLVKRAGSIRDPGRLGPWLHGVARRVALRARAEAARRPRRDLSALHGVAQESVMGPASRAEGEDVMGVIDEEIARLPARCRDAVVLCDLEGRSYAEAARRLHCPLGTVQSRLARGRARLRTRLVSRGVTPLAATAIPAESARAAVPETLAKATIRAATTGAVSASAAGLAGSIARSFLMSTLKNITGLLILASVATGGGLLARDGLLAEPPGRPPAGAAQEPEPPKRDRILNLEVVNSANNAALAGAMVWARVSRGQPREFRGTTDEEGRYTIAIPAGAASSLQVVVVDRGFAPVELRWTADEPIPASYTVSLERGVPIGGTVRDEQGRPIAGARVHLQIGAIPPRGGCERYPSPESELAAAVTDDQGRWRSEALPASAGPGVRLELVTTHPGHVGLKRSVTADALGAFGVAGVMKTGRSLSGTVTSPTGRPVAGATVVIQSRSDRARVQRVQTDRDGRFQTGPFIDPNWSEFTMVVQADGFAAFAQWLLIPAEIPPQAIRLSPRKPLHGRVVDTHGRPIPGAIVRSATDFGFAGLEWEAESNADGRVIWYEAPATGTSILNVQKPPFRQILGYGNDSRQNGPLSSRSLHNEALARTGRDAGRGLSV